MCITNNVCKIVSCICLYDIGKYSRPSKLNDTQMILMGDPQIHFRKTLEKH